MHKIHRLLKTQVLETAVVDVQELLTHKVQEIAQIALVTQLEIATNF